jgi:uncharacterized Zn finger protein
MTAVQNFATHSFSSYALKNIRIDEDANGLIALVPDQSGKWMTVRCAESKTAVTPTSCSCGKHDCKHQAVVTSYYSKLYKVEAPVETSKVAKTRKPRNGLVRKVRNGGLVRVEQPSKVAKVIEQAVEAKVPDMMNAALTKNKGFSLMR